MTTHFRLQVTCPKCGHQSPMETGFCRWMRHHPKLDSSDGIVRSDQDHIILRYKTAHGRSLQLMMWIEVKEYGAEPNEKQFDLLSMANRAAFVRRGKNMHGAMTCTTIKMKSPLNGLVRLRLMGLHLLQFEKTNPEDSEWIKWDRKQITEKQLVGLLGLELDPYRPTRVMDELLRDRHFKNELPQFDFPEFDDLPEREVVEWERG